MPTAKHLRSMFQSASNGDTESFKRVAEEIIKEERAKQHHLLANDLERILYGKQTDVNNLKILNHNVPLDKERGLPLLSVMMPSRSIDDIILSDENRSLIDEILLEQNRKDVLVTYGLKPVDKILFYGPPGCGKTITAEALAYELELPLAILRIDSIVSSYLGETSSNLRSIFDYIKNNRFVVLFDEFDALGRERADISEHGEIKRVVNALLQMFDGYRGDSILIAATNHESNLDTAVWRRFEEVLSFTLPNLEQIKKLLELKLKGVRRNLLVEIGELANRLKGLSHADIERIIRRAIKDMILQGKEFLEDRQIESSLSREEARKRRLQENT
ncbi:AAA family ATPase [Leptospira idonii]|uniref:ATP-binding protein n=1 Tax=Leptospira idonii TaxID=1193500 RepID=A0A4R9LW41_9LEPT|nr:ATP-binding protein [Leptospira idonii]TGN17499.1 ATP-binding protein [Leptospira idonii]